MKLIASLVISIVLASTAWAGDLTISDVWARASAGGAGAGAVFLTITNGGASGDRLISASTPVSQVTELHTHADVNGVMTMRKIDAIDVAGAQKVELKPGGLHIMMMGLSSKLKEGDTFPVTLTFEKAGNIVVSANVSGVAAMGGQHMEGHHDHGGDGHH